MKQTSAIQELSGHGEITAPGTIRFERVLRGPVDRVWSYLTEPDKLGKWLATGSTAARSGSVVEMTWHHDQLSPQHPEPIPEEYKKHQGTVSRWRVVRYEAPRFLSVLWDEETEGASRVTFELTPRGDDVLLVLTHENLRDQEPISDVAGGWHAHLAILEDVLAERTPPPFWATHAKAQAYYRQHARENAR